MIRKRNNNVNVGYRSFLPEFTIDVATQNIYASIVSKVDAEAAMSIWLEYAYRQQEKFYQGLKYEKQAQVNKALLKRIDGVIKDYKRKKKNRDSIVSRKVLWLQFEDVTTEAVQFDLNEAVQYIFDQIHDYNSLLVYASFVRGKTYREIAEMLNRPESSLKDQVRRFRKKINGIVHSAMHLYQIENCNQFFNEFYYKLLTLKELIRQTTK
jgi:DNA-directed RNA polymerase specialized sigma24 family protein